MAHLVPNFVGGWGRKADGGEVEVGDVFLRLIWVQRFVGLDLPLEVREQRIDAVLGNRLAVPVLLILDPCRTYLPRDLK